MNATKIIVPIGLRHEAERIVPIAAEIARDLETDMELVHVVPSLEATPCPRAKRAMDGQAR